MTSRLGRRRPLAAVAVSALGICLLAFGATHLQHHGRQLPQSFGSSALTAGPTAPADAPSSTDNGSASLTPTIGPAPGAGVPLRLSIGRLHVDAPITPVRSADGEISVPHDPSTLGWWIGGATPGSLVGATVIVGHVDSAASGPGALFHLDRVRPGDTVTVTVSGGGTQRYTISALHTVHKSVGISGRDLEDAGPAQLTLITCGGPFDEATKSYQDNIVATAQPTT